MNKKIPGLFVKSPDRLGEVFKVISYKYPDEFVICRGATVPLIDYLGRPITFVITEEAYKDGEKIHTIK